MPHNKHPFNVLKKTDSTNNYAMQKAYAGMATHGEAWFTHLQTAGKGQRGKHWLSEEGKNIAISIVFNPLPLTVSGQFYLSAAVALGCYDFFCKYAGDETSIKWPNDIYWRDRKAGGILIENIITGKKWKWAVVGVGININQTVFSKELSNPVSLKQITGKSNNTVDLAQELHRNILHRVKTLLSGKKAEILKEYNKVLYKLGANVKLKKENMLFETVIKGVDAHGRLHTLDFIEKKYSFGEIEWEL